MCIIRKKKVYMCVYECVYLPIEEMQINFSPYKNRSVE